MFERREKKTKKTKKKERVKSVVSPKMATKVVDERGGFISKEHPREEKGGEF